MSGKSCGCSTNTCGCCAGVEVLTPMSTENRPGLDALTYRVGTHATFFESMKARLGVTSVDDAYPLLGLTTRDTSDPAIALLDAWATAGDVLTFYQERIANEGYLRTATERRSVLELARLVGYTLRPGVAASVYLSYTLDNNQTVPVEIPVGAQAQSIPGPGELPQMFESSDVLEARAEWNNLQVRLTQPQVITLDTAISVSELYVAGTTTQLKAGDSILMVFDDSGTPAVMRKIATVNAEFDTQRTHLTLQMLSPKLLAAFQALVTLIRAIESTAGAQTQKGKQIVAMLEEFAMNTRLGVAPRVGFWVDELVRNQADSIPEFVQPHAAFVAALGLPAPPSKPPVITTDPSQFTASLLAPPVLQARSSLQLTRDLAKAFQQKGDASPQMLLAFQPKLRKTFYKAWASAVVDDKELPLKAVYALRVEAPLFGGNVQKMATYNAAGQINLPQNWTDWTLDRESTKAVFLDQAYDSVLPDSYVVVQRGSGVEIDRSVKRVSAAQTQQRTAYGISGKTTQLQFADKWIDSVNGDLSSLRPVLVYGQSEALSLIEMPITTDISGTEIDLSVLYNGLTSGRWIIVTGERSDIQGVSGVTATELLMVSALRQDTDSVATNVTRTTLVLATNMAYRYKRDTNFKVYANVVKATHGETKNEVLGSGDATVPLQTFALKQPPLTFVSSPNPAGVESTLHVFVNNIEWHETDTLAKLGPKDRNFVTLTDDNNVTSVIFGNGKEGARPPTGVQNVVTVYRSGIGAPGNVDAGQISMLQTRPLGVKSVINPLEASGGADRESMDSARDNVPYAVMSLDRLVSTEDYGNFSRTFAGIGKAISKRLSDGRRQLVEVTIAGVDDAPIDQTSDVYRNLVTALQDFGDPATPVQVDVRELVMLVTSIRIKLLPDYQWDPVASAVNAAILSEFSFGKRAFGQPALLCELIATVQNVEGVAYCDVDAFGGVPEKTVDDETGARVLVSLPEISFRVQTIVHGSQNKLKATLDQRVDVNDAAFEGGAVRPAQLAVFSDAVQDTIVLNQIL